MAAKKKSKNKLAKKKTAKKPTAKKALAPKKKTPKKKSSQNKKSPTKSLTKKKKVTPKKKSVNAKPIVRKRVIVSKKRSEESDQNANPVKFPRRNPGSSSAGQSGDLQGLSTRESADSESVDELLEEGNSFEAGIVSGVQDADGADEREVRTHEVLEDDVPGEYLDED
jgi:hypothetical protein